MKGNMAKSNLIPLISCHIHSVLYAVHTGEKGNHRVGQQI